MDADSVSHMMHCKHLITDDDYDVITSAPNDIKMNCLILQYVKMMDVPMLLEFCDILKGIETQQCIGETLEKCKCIHVCLSCVLPSHFSLNCDFFDPKFDNQIEYRSFASNVRVC